jgi:hypothetical protein
MGHQPIAGCFGYLPPKLSVKQVSSIPLPSRAGIAELCDISPQVEKIPEHTFNRVLID